MVARQGAGTVVILAVLAMFVVGLLEANGAISKPVAWVADIALVLFICFGVLALGARQGQ